MSITSNAADSSEDSSGADEKPDRDKFVPGGSAESDPSGWKSETRESSEPYVSQPLSLQILGDFKLGRQIGRGGMGVVYEARQLSLDKRVAVKVLPFASVLDQRVVKRFKTEAWAAAQLQHRNIVPVYHVGTERGIHYYAMQYIEGGDLGDLYNALQDAAAHGSTHKDPWADAPTRPRKGTSGKGQVDISTPTEVIPAPDLDATVKDGSTAVRSIPKSGWSKGHTLASRSLLDLVAKNGSTSIPDFIVALVNMGIQVADALQHAHEIGIVHRDIKPSNLLLDVDGDVWVADFGLAQIEADPGMTATGAIVGTLRYVSPEQALGKRIGVDHRTDIYSLGVTLYELLTLTPAFTGDSREHIIRKITFEEPAAPRKIDRRIPEELETIVIKAMSKNPGDRYQTAAEMADDLRRFRDNQPIKGRKPGVRKRLLRWARRHRPVVASAAGILTATFIASIIIAVILWNYYAATAVALQAVQEQKTEVERLLARSDGLRLAAYSTIELESDPTRALLLALEAAERHPGVDANHAILQALNAGHEHKTLLGHPAAVGYVAFNADGKRVISCSIQARYDEGPDPAMIWDSQTGELLGSLQPTGNTATSITSCLFYPNGGRILATSSPRRDQSTDDLNGTLAGVSPAIWDELTLKQLKVFPDAFLFETHPAVFDAEGNRVVLPAIGNTARIYDSRDATELIPLRGHTKRVVFAAFSPDGSRVATASDDNTVRIWDAKTGEKQYEFTLWQQRAPKAERCLIDAVAFRADSQQLLTASKTLGTHLWDLTNGSRINKQNFPGNFAAYLPGGLRFVSRFSAGASELTIRDSRRGDPLGVLKPRDGSISESLVSADARWIAMQDQRVSSLVSLWKTSRHDRESVLQGHLAIVNDLAFSPDSQLIATASSDQTVRLWHVQDGRERLTYRARVPLVDPVCVASSDGKNLAVATSEDFREGRVVDLADGNIGSAITGKTWMPTHATSRLVAWADNTLTVHSILDGSKVGETTFAAEDSIRDAAINRDGDRVAALGAGEMILLWMPADDRQLSLLGPTKAYEVAFNPAGDRLATAHANGEVRIWDADTGDSLAALPNDGNVVSLAFSPDGKQLAVVTNQNRAILWDCDRFEQLVVLHSDDSSFNRIRFTADGLAAFSFRSAASKSVHLWDTRTGKQLGTLEATGKVHVAVHPTETEALVASSESGVIVWNYPDNARSSITKAPMIQCGYSADGNQFYLGSEVPGLAKSFINNNEPFAKSAVELWQRDSDTARQRWELPYGSIGRLFVGNQDRLLVDVVNRFSVVNFDPQTHARKAVMHGHTAPVTAAVFNGDASRLVTAARDRQVFVWDPRSGERIATLSGHQSPITSAALAANDSVLVTGDESGKCIQWDFATAAKTAEYQVAPTAIKYLGVDAAGQRMIAISADHSLAIRDLQQQQAIDLNLADRAIEWAEFSADGNYLLVVDALSTENEGQDKRGENRSHTVDVVAFADAKVTTITRQAPVISAHFHPDGKRVVTATTTGAPALHDLATGDRLQTLPPAGVPIQALAVDSSGEFVAAASARQINVWRLPGAESWLTIPRFGLIRDPHRFDPFLNTSQRKILTLRRQVQQYRDWPLHPATAARGEAPRALTSDERSRFYLPN